LYNYILLLILTSFCPLVIGEEGLYLITSNDTHTHTHIHTHLIGFLCTRNLSVAETSTYTTHNTHKRQTSMPPARFENAIPASEQPQTHALERAATGIIIVL